MISIVKEENLRKIENRRHAKSYNKTLFAYLIKKKSIYKILLNGKTKNINLF